MRLILQRVSSASVRVDGDEVARIGLGLVILVGVEKRDDESHARAAAEKVATLRVFSDNQGKMNLDALAAGGELLVVSQFTLAASLDRGRRPSFDRAAAPEIAAPLIETLVAELAARGLPTKTGRFGARMQVELVNDGPVTLVLDL